MDIRLLFDRVPEFLTEASYDAHSIFRTLHMHNDSAPDLDQIDIAIIGLKDGRSVADKNGIANAADQIRKQLYHLKKGKSTYRIADLGNLRSGHDVDETKGRLAELMGSLYEKGILPVIIGGSHDFDLAQYQSYEMSDKLVSVVNVDAKIDMEQESANSLDGHIHEIMVQEPNYLFDYIHLGYQSYLVPSNTLEVLEKLNFNLLRLGRIRDDVKEVEPRIRQADMLSFDLSALQKSFMNAVNEPNVFGLTGEEACQLTWYAGSSEQLSSAGFYGYDPSLDDEEKSSAFVIGTMLYYFIEGFYNRKDKHEFTSKHYLRYIVAFTGQEPGEIVFYKSAKSDKWWMEVPFQEPKGLMPRNRVVPCSYEDYECATKGEIPDRWIATSNKMN